MPIEKKQYEISYLTRTEADKDTVLTALGETGAENLQEGRMAEIKLAYPIKKQTSAFFGSTVFEAGPESISKINDILKFAEGILRFLIVTPPAQKPQPRFGGRDKAIEGETVEQAKNEEALVKAEKEASEPEKKAEIDDTALDEKLEEILTSTK